MFPYDLASLIPPPLVSWKTFIEWAMGRRGSSWFRLAVVLCFLSARLASPQALIPLIKVSCSSLCEKNDLALHGFFNRHRFCQIRNPRALERKRSPLVLPLSLIGSFNFSKPQPTPKFVSQNLHIRQLWARGNVSESSHLGSRAQNLYMWIFWGPQNIHRTQNLYMWRFWGPQNLYM